MAGGGNFFFQTMKQSPHTALYSNIVYGLILIGPGNVGIYHVNTSFSPWDEIKTGTVKEETPTRHGNADDFARSCVNRAMGDGNWHRGEWNEENFFFFFLTEEARGLTGKPLFAVDSYSTQCLLREKFASLNWA